MLQRGTTTVWQRMFGAAVLDPQAYEAVEHDESATTAALLIVLVAAAATGIGAFTATGYRGLYRNVIADLISWALYATFAYFIGTRIFRTEETRATVGELLRTLGFAQVPAFLLVFAGVPVFGPFLEFVISIWILAATVVAIRQALDFTTLRAVGTAVVAWLLYVIPFALILVAIP